MNDQNFDTRLTDLLGQIEHLPDPERDRLRSLAEETRTRRDRMSKTVAHLQESLDYLRLNVKYLVFDLEATRRENQYLRQLLLEGTHEDDREGAD